VKLLLITQYFPPEVGAPQNRLSELALRLIKEGVEITVLTAMPNYPQMEIHKEYIGKKYFQENIEGCSIHRTAIYVSKSKSIAARLRNYFSFVWSSYKYGIRKLDQNYDAVFCESPPLFLGISAYLIAKRKKAKFIFNVSDLWPESAEKLGLVKNKIFLKLATILEEFLYKKADLITGQTKGITSNISSRFPNKNIHWLPNGVDLNFYNPKNFSDKWRIENNFKKEDVLFFYGGIIGHAQGLEIIIHAANELKNNSNIIFILLGSGPEKENLISLKNKLNLKNIVFMDAVSKSEMPSIISAVDCSIIPLKKLDLFLGAIPSKIFECLSMETPILLGVDGEAKGLFIDKAEAGIYFEPENIQALKQGVLNLAKNSELRKKLGQNGRTYVDKQFNRNQIAVELKYCLEDLF
jgi:glycosyltransferase involved in cell wall biosynthesis